MLRGHLDAVTSSGYIDGWAYDTEAPARPLALAIHMNEAEIGRGLANRYRTDLVDAGCGIGWCAFHIRIAVPVSRARRLPLTLILLPGGDEVAGDEVAGDEVAGDEVAGDEVAGDEVAGASGLPVIEDTDLPLMQVDDVARADPTLVGAIEELRGCGTIFSALIERSGLEVFVRAAYVYLLGRPADPSGIETYSRLIGSGELSPFAFLGALCDSDEFRAAPRLLIAPTEPGFIFAAL